MARCKTYESGVIPPCPEASSGGGGRQRCARLANTRVGKGYWNGNER